MGLRRACRGSELKLWANGPGYEPRQLPSSPSLSFSQIKVTPTPEIAVGIFPFRYGLPQSLAPGKPPVSGGFASITMVITIYFEIGLLLPKPEAIVSLFGPLRTQTPAEGPGRGVAGRFGLELTACALCGLDTLGPGTHWDSGRADGNVRRLRCQRDLRLTDPRSGALTGSSAGETRAGGNWGSSFGTR